MVHVADKAAMDRNDECAGGSIVPDGAIHLRDPRLAESLAFENA